MAGASSDEPSCPPQICDYTKRYEPLRGHIVYGYPSSGGVLIKGVGAVKLLHLNMDRFKDAKRASDLAEEDRFVRDFK
jgi:hypothetical protein